MANGHRALSLVSEPPATLVPPTEEKIGQAVADIACLLCAAAFEFQGGRLAPAIKAEGGSRVARLYELQMAHAGETDFASVARAHGRTALRRFFTLDFYRARGPGAGEAALDEVVEEVLEILGRVTAFERAMAN